MDLVVFAGFLVAAGYYINDGSFEGFQPRAILSRKTLPENEVLSGDDNVYRSRMLERSQKYAQDQADDSFAKSRLRKMKMKTNMKNVQGFETDPISPEDDSFAMYAFDEKPDYRASRRSLNLNKLRQFKSEGFIPGAGAPNVTSGRGGEINEWNGPELPQLFKDEDQRIRSEKIAREQLTGIQDGVMIDDRIQDRPLLEHEIHLLPKSADEFRVKPLNSYTIDRVMPEGVIREEPPILPTISRRYQTAFETNDTFTTPSTTFGDATAARPEMHPLKQDTTFIPRLNAGGVARGLESMQERSGQMNSFKLGNRFTYNPLNFERPTSLIDALPRRNIKVPRTRKEELNHVNYLALDGVQDYGFQQNEVDAPRVTQRETFNIDGRLAATITAPYDHPSHDISQVELPRPTNKENNMTSVVGLPGVDNVASTHDFEMDLPFTMKDQIAMRSFAYVSPAEAPIGNMPVAGTSTKHSNTVKYYESRQPNLDNQVNAPPVIGDTDRKRSTLKGLEMDWTAPLDMSNNKEQYANVESVAETFDRYTRKPTEFY